MSPTLVKSVRFLAALGGLALVLTGECQPPFIAVFMSFFAIGFIIVRFPALAKILGGAQPFLALVVFAVALVDFFYLSNSFLLTVAHFLLSLQGLRLLALRTNRECLGSLLVSSLMVLSASTLSVEWTYFLVLFLFLVFVVWTLMLLTMLQEAESASPRVELKENTPLWLQTFPVLRRAAVAAFFLALLCCAVVFVVFPRFNLQGFRGQFLQPVHKTGFTSQVDLTGGGKIFTDDSIVMRVEIAPKDRNAWTGYLRGRALESFDGRRWKKAQIPVERVYSAGRSEIRMPVRDEAPGELLRQVIYLESMDSPALFTAARPELFKIERLFLEVFDDGSVQRGNGDTWRVRYEVNSYLSQMDPVVVERSRTGRFSSLRARITGRNGVARPLGGRTAIPKRVEAVLRTDPSYRSVADELLAVPPAENEKLSALTAEITHGIKDRVDQAEKIAAHLRQNYTYSLAGGPLKKQSNPVETFLFETKIGHCEYFAASMCLMLRTRGIPARMVTGFLSNEWNARGHYVVVRMRHAHAWVEAFIEPYGWLGFDPSPRAVSETALNSGFLSRWSETMDYLNLRWNRYILSYDLERQVSIVRGFTQQSNLISLRIGRVAGFSQRLSALFSGRRFASESTASQGAVGKILPILLISLFVAAMVFAAMSLRRRRFQNKVWFYGVLLRYLEKKGGPKPDGITLIEFLEKCASRLGAAAPAARFLAEHYYRLRFDPAAALSGPENRAILEQLKLLKNH